MLNENYEDVTPTPLEIKAIRGEVRHVELEDMIYLPNEVNVERVKKYGFLTYLTKYLLRFSKR